MVKISQPILVDGTLYRIVDTSDWTRYAIVRATDQSVVIGFIQQANLRTKSIFVGFNLEDDPTVEAPVWFKTSEAIRWAITRDKVELTEEHPKMAPNRLHEIAAAHAVNTLMAIQGVINGA